MPQDVITLVILAVTVVMIVSLITDCVKDGHRTEERILIRKESMLRRKIEAKEKKRAEKLPLQNEAGQEESADLIWSASISQIFLYLSWSYPP